MVLRSAGWEVADATCWTIIVNERHLKRLMSSYLLYYHEDRTHLGLAKDTQQVGLQRFALRVKTRSNPFRDSAGYTIVMRWQRSLKSHSSEDQTIFLATQPRTVHVFGEEPFAGRRIILQSETVELPSFLQIERDPFNVGHNDLANDNLR
jgi:hypothetical protein